MPEALETEATTEATEPEATTEATTTESSASEPVEETWDDPEALPEDQDLFPRSYVEELRDREARYRIKARDSVTQLDEFGGVDAVRAAVELHQSLQTDDGVVSMFIEAGRALGLGVDQLEALFGESAAESGTEQSALDGLNDEDEISVKDARALIAAEVERAIQSKVVAPQAEQEYAEAVQTAQRTVRDTVAELKIADEDVDGVLSAGQKYLKDGDLDPANIAAAVRRGHEDYEKALAQRAEKRLQAKAKVKETVPSSTGASTPGGTALPEPQNSEEAKKRARQRLRLAGGE